MNTEFIDKKFYQVRVFNGRQQITQDTDSLENANQIAHYWTKQSKISPYAYIDEITIKTIDFKQL